MPDYMSLRLAVDELTKPVTGWVEDREGNKHSLRSAAPLIEQLREAIHSDLSSHSGSGKLARERTPIDVGAFTLFEEIDGLVRAWMFDLGGRVGSKIPAGEVLRSWFVMFMAHATREQGVVDAHEVKVLRWAARIRELLFTPPPFEITEPCPACGVDYVTVGHGDDAQRKRTIEVLYPNPSDMSTWFVKCKNCPRLWTGLYELRALRTLIDDAAKVRELRSLIDEMEIAS